MGTNEETKALKEVGAALTALNINVMDCAKSLRELVKQRNRDDYWHPTFGPDGGLPTPEYDWVLVKLKDSSEIYPNSACHTYNIPHIAEFRKGRWWSLETGLPYDSPENPFKVIYWRPLPG